MAEAIALALGGLGGYLIGQNQQGQPVRIPVSTGVRESICVFDTVSAATKKDYETKLLKQGKVIAVWLQFYWTTCLLKYSVTVDGTSVFRTIQGSEDTIALHNVAETFLVNQQFQQGAILKVTADNTDPGFEHRVRCVVIVEYS
jgi:hypothetical protein